MVKRRNFVPPERRSERSLRQIKKVFAKGNSLTINFTEEQWNFIDEVTRRNRVSANAVVRVCVQSVIDYTRSRGVGLSMNEDGDYSASRPE